MGCWDKIKIASPEIYKYIKEKTGIEYDPDTKAGRSEYLKVAKELQAHSLKTIVSVYENAGVKGFEKKIVPETENVEPANGEKPLEKTTLANVFNTLGNQGLAVMEADIKNNGKSVINGIDKATPKQIEKIKSDFEELKNKYPDKNLQLTEKNNSFIIGEKQLESITDEDKSVVNEDFIKENDAKFKLVGDVVDGRKVRDKVPNMSSIESTFNDGEYEILSGIREVPMSEFELSGGVPKRGKELAEQINDSGELNPLIVVVDKEGAYILEGANRFDALREIGAKSFPAKVVIDTKSFESEKKPTSPPETDNSVEANPTIVSDKAQVSKQVADKLDRSHEFYDTGKLITLKKKNVTVEFGREELENGDDSLFINDISTDPKHQSKGNASSVLKEITNYADNNDMPISLRASIGGHGDSKTQLTQEQLIKWYEKHGFELKPEASKFGKDDIFMVREPKSTTKPTKVSNKAEVVETETEVPKTEIKVGDTFGKNNEWKVSEDLGNKVKAINEQSGVITTFDKKDIKKAVQATESQIIEPPKPPIDNVKENIPEGETVGISHAQTEAVRKKFGLNDYERNNATDTELEAKANEVIKEGYDPENLVRQMEGGTPPTGVENFILKKYLATLEAKFDKSPTDENLAPIERLVKATDKIGSLQSEAFRTRKGIVPVDESLAGFFITEKEVNLDAPLTEKQKETVKKEYADISEAQQKYDKKIAALEAENNRVKAEAEVKKVATKKTPTSVKRTHEDFVKERRDILDSIREKLKKARGEISVTPIPYAKELVTIAPDVARLVKNLVEEGIVKLSDIVADIHDSLKDNIKGLTKEDIHNIIAGEYNESKQPKNEISRKLFELRQEAQLINKYEKLENGIEPKNEKDKIKRNQELEKLRKQIKEHDLTKLADYKSKTKARIEKLEEDLRTENFLKPESAKTPIILDKEAIEAKDKLIKLKNERQFRILLHQHKNLSTSQKVITGISEVLNVPRALMTIVDYSALLRQGLIQSISHPMFAAEATKKMLQAGASQKIYDRWFYDLKDTPRFQLMEKSKLGITDSTNPLLSAREEAFMSNLAEKIPIIGKTLTIGKVKIPGTNLVKGSERAYSMFLNKMRSDVFNRFADAMESRGLTFENSPEAFKQMAEYVNNSTGRGSIGNTLNKIAPLLNSLFFSPRLIASRLNMLTYLAQPRFYKTVPKEVRAAYFKDMAKFIGVGMTVLGLASLGGKDDETTVETDPRSSDFGKIKNKNTRWDIWGGFQQYIRVAAQTLMGERKKANGKISKLDGKHAFGEDKGDVLLKFGRGKLAPVPSMAIDLFSGRTQIGDKIIFDTGTEKNKEITIDRYLKEHLLPLTYTGLEESIKDQGVKALFTVGVPSVFGVGVQTFDSNNKKK